MAKITGHDPEQPATPLSDQEKAQVESAMQLMLSMMDNHGLESISFNDGNPNIVKKRP